MAPLSQGHLKITRVQIFYIFRMFERYCKDENHPSIEHRCIDGCRGIKIPCADIPCVFEFTVFRCKEHVPYQPPATTVSAVPVAFPLPKPPAKNAETSAKDGQALAGGSTGGGSNEANAETSTTNDGQAPAAGGSAGGGGSSMQREAKVFLRG